MATQSRPDHDATAGRPREEIDPFHHEPAPEQESAGQPERAAIDGHEPAAVVPTPPDPPRSRRVRDDADLDLVEDRYGIDNGAASVIEIGRDDDIASIAGSIDTAPTYAVVIYARRGNRDLNTELGMRRLKRHADDTGKVVAIATRKRGLRDRAREAGIATGPKPSRIRWDAAGSNVVYLPFFSIRTPALGDYGRALLLLLGIGGLVALVLTMAPSAKITVIPDVEPVTTTVEVTGLVAGDPDDFPDATGVVVNTDDATFTVDLTLTQPVTGVREVPQARAWTHVTVANPGRNPVSIPKGTVVTTADGMLTFVFDDNVTVGAASAVEDVVVIAGERGDVYNVEPGTITAFQDPAYANLNITNPEPARDGVTVQQTFVTEEDIAALRAQEEKVTTSDGIRKTIAAQHPDDAIFLNTMSVRGAEATAPPNPGTETDLITIVYRVSVSARIIPGDEVRKIARDVLHVELLDGEFIDKEIYVEDLGPATVDSTTGAIRTTMRFTGFYAQEVTGEEIRDLVSGKSPGDARQALNDRLGQRDHDVDLTPGFMPWLPRFDFRTDVDFELPPSALPIEDVGGDSDGGTTAAGS